MRRIVIASQSPMVYLDDDGRQQFFVQNLFELELSCPSQESSEFLSRQQMRTNMT